MEITLSGDDLPPLILSVAKSLDKNNLKDITARSYEDCINGNKQRTKSSSMADAKESEKAVTFLPDKALRFAVYTLSLN